MGQVGK